MFKRAQKEGAQATIEFGIIGVAVMILSVGLVDVGRAFYQYNAVSSAARFGARWASVVGGSCVIPGPMSSSDWCNQLALRTGKNFWQQVGNTPLQGNATPCPSYVSDLDNDGDNDSSTSSDSDGSNPPDSVALNNTAPDKYYYSVTDPDNDGDNDYSSAGDVDNDPSVKSTTIIGSIGQHFDTSASSTSFIQGNLAGFDFSKLKVCIQNTGTGQDQTAGDYVTVTVYYHFDPINFLVARGGFDLVATSQYEVE